MTERELCNTCGGNGVLKIHHGVTVCRDCEGGGWKLHREMTRAALDQLHAAQQRIAALEAQLKAAREEIRRYVRAKMGGDDGLS